MMALALHTCPCCGKPITKTLKVGVDIKAIKEVLVPGKDGKIHIIHEPEYFDR